MLKRLILFLAGAVTGAVAITWYWIFENCQQIEKSDEIPEKIWQRKDKVNVVKNYRKMSKVVKYAATNATNDTQPVVLPKDLDFSIKPTPIERYEIWVEYKYGDFGDIHTSLDDTQPVKVRDGNNDVNDKSNTRR